MEGVDSDPKLSVMSQIEDATTSFSTLLIEQNPILSEDLKESQHEEEEEEGEEDRMKKLANLQRDLTTSVTNIITAADAKEMKRRAELEEACKIRLELLEKDVMSTHANCEELAKGWQLKNKNEKMIPQELEKALKGQQQLCAVVLQEKKRLLNDLHQDVKRRNELHDKTLKENAKEIDLLMERHKHQIDVLTRAYSQELKDTERVYMKEFEMLHSDDKMRLEQELKAFNNKEETMETLTKTTMEKCQEKIQQEVMTTREEIVMELKQLLEWQDAERKKKKMASKLVVKDTTVELIERETRIEAKLRKQLLSLKSEMKDLKAKLVEEDEDFTKKNRPLLDDYKRFMHRYERLQNQVKHFARADARQYEEVWRTIDTEVKLCVKKALEIDSLICSHLGLVWKPPPMAFMEVCGPIGPQRRGPAHQPFQTESASKGSPATPMMDASVGLSPETIESLHLETDKEGKAVHVESNAALEEEEKMLETVVEMLCDEAGFLITDILLNILTSLEPEKQTGVKLASLLCTLGIEDKDVSKLTLFLLNYDRQQRERTENVCGSGPTEEAEKMGAEFMDRNNVLFALKSFLEHNRRSRRSFIQEQSGSRLLEGEEAAAAEAYWESMGNIISEDKVKLWDAAEVQLRKCQAMLTEMCDHTSESETAEQQNTQLRKLLHQHQEYSGADMFD